LNIKINKINIYLINTYRDKIMETLIIRIIDKAREEFLKVE